MFLLYNILYMNLIYYEKTPYYLKASIDFGRTVFVLELGYNEYKDEFSHFIVKYKIFQHIKVRRLKTSFAFVKVKEIPKYTGLITIMFYDARDTAKLFDTLANTYNFVDEEGYYVVEDVFKFICENLIEVFPGLRYFI